MELFSRSSPAPNLELRSDDVTPTVMGCAQKEKSRRMRAHRKSRQGCRNCKIRKVKCDESKPGCQKCEVYGIFCNYNTKFSDLQSAVNGAIKVEIIKASPCSEIQTILSIINATPTVPNKIFGSGIDRESQFRAHDLELLYRFHTRTVLTLGTAKHRELYQKAYTKLAYSHRFLLHVVLTLTMMHDRHLGIDATSEQSAAIAFNWAQGAALLNNKLSFGIDPSERDALWACAGLLATLAFASFPAKSPEEAWPLKMSSSSDLDWLRMSTGKMEIWKIADPLRTDSIFHPMAPDFEQYAHPTASAVPVLNALPPELIQLCRIDATTSTQENNPYLASASVLAELFQAECDVLNVGRFLVFFGCMHAEYKMLLSEKDPCALVLLAYWYAKMCQYRQWWIWQRAVLECQAICIYMKRYHDGDHRILKLMRYAENMCGLH